MKYIFHILLLLLLESNNPIFGAWRLGKPRHLTPTIENLNTYTLLPCHELPLPEAQWEVRKFTTTLKKQKPPKSAQIIIYEKINTKKERLKRVKGYSTVLSGIPNIDCEYITIACRGFALRKNPKNGLPQQGGGLIDGYSRLRHDVCHTPLVTFDFPDQRRTFNFAQELDQACLRTIYDEVIRKNPNAKIILTGDCRGALNVLKFAATNPKNLYALVLTSPFVSAQEVARELSKNYLNKYLGDHSIKLLHNFFQWWFPNYDPAQDNLWNYLHLIKDKKILIVHRSGDTMITDATVQNLTRELKQMNEVYVSVVYDKSAQHAKLVQVTECQQIMNAFYEKYGINHHVNMAESGKAGLAIAQKMAELS